MKTVKHLGKRGLAILLALVMCVGMLNLTAFAAAPKEKFKLVVSSELRQGVEEGEPIPTIEVTGTVYDDYTAVLHLPNKEVNASNVTIEVSMTDVESLGVTGYKSATILNLETGVDVQIGLFDALAILDGLMGREKESLKDFSETTINASITGSNGDTKLVTYELTGDWDDETGKTITGKPQPNNGLSGAKVASEAWHLMVNDTHFDVGTVKKESVIAKGSQLQIGSKAVQLNINLSMDTITDVLASEDAVELLEVEESDTAQIVLAKGTRLAVGNRYAELKTDVAVTVGIGNYDFDQLLEMLTDTSIELNDTKAIILGLLVLMNEAIDLVDNNTIDVAITFGHEWDEGENGHTCAICGESEDHTWGEWTAENGQHIRECEKCGDTETHEATKWGEWTIDADGHSRKCEDCDITDSGEHKYEDGSHECTICHESTAHVDANHDHVCDTCGETVSSHVSVSGSHRCGICGKSISSHRDANGDHKCDTCSSTLSEHADGDADHKCDLCGVTLSECADTDADHKCDLCGEVLTDHEDADSDHTCDVCGVLYTDHEDADSDHKCDLCGETLSDHEDADSDHDCDYCGVTLSECADEDADHKCDVCGEVLTDHEDADADHTCDVCGVLYTDHEDADSDHSCDVCGEVLSDHVDADGDYKCDVCGESVGEPEEPAEPAEPEDEDPPAAGESTAKDPVTDADSGETTVEVETGSDTEGTTAKAEVSTEDADKAIEATVEAAAENGTAAVVKIEVKTDSRANALEATLPKASLETLTKAKNSSLVIKSKVAEVALDHTAMSALVEQATSNTVTLVVTPVAEAEMTEDQKAAVGTSETTKVIDVSMISNNVKIHNYNGGKIKVTLPYTLTEGQKAENIKVFYLDDNGNMEPCETSCANGAVTFTTTHLSMYVIVDTSEAEAPEAGEPAAPGTPAEPEQPGEPAEPANPAEGTPAENEPAGNDPTEPEPTEPKPGEDGGDVVDIPEDDVPLAPGGDNGDGDLTDIPEDDVPLAPGASNDGASGPSGISPLWFLLLIPVAGLAVWFILLARKKKEND